MGADLAIPVFEPWTDPQAKPLIQFQNVTKRFGDFTAIDDLTIDIFEREFFALLGPSGCGKTTMMRMLAGFEAPTEGKIFLAGQDIAPVPPNQRAVNMMFQSYALFPHLSVWENIAFGLKREGLPRNDINARVEEMLRLTRLEKFARRKPHQISGGQRQRVALARSLAKAPKLLLLDEPLGALDKKLREETQFELMDLQQELGLTFVIVTHDQDEAMTMSDRIALMDAGVVKQIGTPAEIYEAPDSRYVADFIGSVNIFEGKVKENANGLVKLDSPDGFSEIQAVEDRQFETGQDLFLAIRPEKMNLTRERPTEANAASGEVWEIAYMGDVTNYIVKLDGGKMVRASVVNRKRSVENPIGYDEVIWVSFEPDGGTLLDR